MKMRRTSWFLVSGAAVLALGFAMGVYWQSSDVHGRVAHYSDSTRSPTVANRPGPARPSIELSDATSPSDQRSSATAAQVSVTRLASLKVTPQEPRSVRALLVELEKLRGLGAAAIPAIREFLASGQDADYDALGGRGIRNGAVPLDFTVPPSLRLGLLEVLKNIGGPEAEATLLHELQATGRGVEAAYLGGVLQQIAPEKYRDAALTAARDLLAMPLTSRAPNPLDRSDREYLYGMLAAAGDQSRVMQAQTQLLLPNGQVDQGALRYLRQMLGEQVVGIVSQTWQDPRIAASEREPLARVALGFVGTNASAEQIYRTAIDDPALSPAARKNLIEDLNETGFPDPKHLTPADLPMIQKRLALIEQLAAQTSDRTNAAAFAEARKDLLNMRDHLLATSAPKK